jgi:hypothetical protein
MIPIKLSDDFRESFSVEEFQEKNLRDKIIKLFIQDKKYKKIFNRILKKYRLSYNKIGFSVSGWSNSVDFVLEYHNIAIKLNDQAWTYGAKLFRIELTNEPYYCFSYNPEYLSEEEFMNFIHLIHPKNIKTLSRKIKLLELNLTN